MYDLFGRGMVLRRSVLTLFALLMVGFLSACDSAEERAEKHFQSALTLLQEGDEERAIVEFRNVFKLNGLHKEARTEYANLQRRRGNLGEAIGQYLRLVEQYPDDLEGNRALAEMYAEIGKWDDMDRYVNAVLEIEPSDTGIRALQNVSQYRVAVDNRDEAAATAAVEKAAKLQEELPENIMIWQVLIDNDMRNSRFGSALAGLDKAIEIAPTNRDLYTVRLSVLGALDDTAAIEAQLKDMIKRFPDDDSSRLTLVRWFVSQNNLDEAQHFLREAVDLEPDNIEARMTYLRFLSELRGQDVALAELNTMIEGGLTTPIFLSLKSSLEFELGEQETAISEMEALIASMEDGDEKRTIKVGLARMLLSSGNVVGSRALVEEVLSEDKSQVEALKMKASWLIDGDAPGEAIVALRAALDQSPRDSEIMTLLARAHERDGNNELVGEMLALAVEASNRGADESVRYAQYLITANKLGPAEGVLIDSLRLSPANHDLLFELGTVYIEMKDWERSKQVIDALRAIETPDGDLIANELQARLLEGQEDTEGTLEFLKGLVAEGSAGFQANMAIVTTLLSDGKFDEARAYVDDLLAATPDDLGVQYMDATVNAAHGETDKAEAQYRAILAKNPQEINVWIALFRINTSADDMSAAKAVLEEALAAMPDEPTLKWIKAGFLEQDGDIEGAIAIYEDMYAEDSDNMVVANNLASLITSLNEDPETIERAYAIARRLRVSTVPPFQDTYGWIAFLRGDFEEAILALEPAAAGLPNDPTVQYHLARAYVAAERYEAAMERFENVLELTGPDDPRDFVKDSKSEIARLSSLPQ
ncbi:MAG: tetratricopeptide repeat protein [Marinosulfonomonas sp.]